MLFYLKRSFADLTPNIFLPLYKTLIRPNIEWSIQATHPILCRQGTEKVQKLALKFVKGLRHVPYEAALKQLRLFSFTHRRIRGDLIAMFRITHGLLEFPVSSTFAHPTRKVPPTTMLYALSQMRLHKLPAEIVNASSVESFKTLLDAHWQSLFPEVPI